LEFGWRYEFAEKDREKAMEILRKAYSEGKRRLSEYDAKRVLSAYGIRVSREALTTTESEMLDAAADIGYPVVLKGCREDLVHKSEAGVVRTDIRNEAEAKASYTEIRDAMAPKGGVSVLVQEMLGGKRELVAGMTRDPQFGPAVMFGLGGIFTEILNDVVFRIAPIEPQDAFEMMDEIRGRRILDGIRGMPPADREQLKAILIAIGRMGLDFPMIKEVDINPLIICDGQPVAVDAMIGLDTTGNGQDS